MEEKIDVKKNYPGKHSFRNYSWPPVSSHIIFRVCSTSNLMIWLIMLIRAPWEKVTLAPAGVAQWIECWPLNPKVTSLIPSQGTCLGCGLGSRLGVCKRQLNLVQEVAGYVSTLWWPKISPSLSEIYSQNWRNVSRTLLWVLEVSKHIYQHGKREQQLYFITHFPRI